MIKDQLVKAISKVVIVKNQLVAPKRVFVNLDGTIAENKETYKEFRQDLGNRNYGW